MIYSIDNYFDYIDKNYLYIKDNFKRILYSQHIKFDEDIFHNTIYNCYTLLNDNKLIFNYDKELFSYLLTSLKFNIFRNTKYTYNSKAIIDLNDVDLQSECSIEYDCDINIIYSKIKNKFGEQLLNLFYENINGTSIMKLQNKYHVKNLKAKIKEIKDYLINERENY